MTLLCVIGFHSWNGCQCRRCGKKRDQDHDWGDLMCRVCRAVSVVPIADHWAEKLKDAKNYRALADYLCTSPKHGDSPIGYENSVDLWNRKIRRAEWILESAGADALEAMLASLEAGEHKDSKLAVILTKINDPRAVPLLKQLYDRGEWAAESRNKEIADFVNKYPQYHGEKEMAACAICGKVRPIDQFKLMADRRFCDGECWSGRGRVIAHGIGTNCPYYVEGVCRDKNGRDSGLCSLQVGSFETSCYVFSLRRGGPR
jgi:hypothetical protein